MSPFEHVKAVRSLPPEVVKGAARMVLMVLATHCDQQSNCYPSVKLLTKECALTERGVRKALAQLREAGLIHTVRRGPNGVNVVHLNLVQGEHSSGPDLNVVPLRPERGSPKESRKGPTEESTPPSPPSGDVLKLVKVMVAQLEANGDEGWDPDNHAMVVRASDWCKAERYPSGVRRVEQAMRIALAQYRGEA